MASRCRLHQTRSWSTTRTFTRTFLRSLTSTGRWRTSTFATTWRTTWWATCMSSSGTRRRPRARCRACRAATTRGAPSTQSSRRLLTSGRPPAGSTRRTPATAAATATSCTSSPSARTCGGTCLAATSAGSAAAAAAGTGAAATTASGAGTGTAGAAMEAAATAGAMAAAVATTGAAAAQTGAVVVVAAAGRALLSGEHASRPGTGTGPARAAPQCMEATHHLGSTRPLPATATSDSRRGCVLVHSRSRYSKARSGRHWLLLFCRAACTLLQVSQGTGVHILRLGPPLRTRLRPLLWAAIATGLSAGRCQPAGLAARHMAGAPQVIWQSCRDCPLPLLSQDRCRTGAVPQGGVAGRRSAGFSPLELDAKARRSSCRTRTQLSLHMCRAAATGNQKLKHGDVAAAGRWGPVVSLAAVSRRVWSWLDRGDSPCSGPACMMPCSNQRGGPSSVRLYVLQALGPHPLCVMCEWLPHLTASL